MRSPRSFFLPTMDDVLARHADERPDAIAIEFGERSWSYPALQRQAERIARHLIAQGLMAGDRVAYLGRNSDALPLLAMGAMRAGLIFVPINARLAPAEIDNILRDAGCKLAFLSDEFSAVDLGDTCSRAPLSVLIDKDMATASPTSPLPDNIGAEDIALLLYTSGTTGEPKGVALPHRSLFGTSTLRQKAALEWDTWNSDDVTLIPIPLAHSGGMSLLMRSLFFGGSAVIQETFDPAGVLQAISDKHVSKLGLVPTAIRIVLEHPQAHTVDYSRLKTVIYGAAPIGPDLLKDAVHTFRCEFVQSYGMTETFATCMALAPSDHASPESPRMKSAGRPLPGTEVRIVDATGAPLPTGQSGEISIRSVAIMAGYWNKPEATAAVLDDAGWYRTGDAGYIDDDGYLFIRDRLKDMIISGAENIYPAEVEKVLSGHPDIQQVAVIGVPDPFWGEAVKGIVVPIPGRSINVDDILAWAKQRIAPFKVPKSLDIVSELPLNASGKVQKAMLRAPYWSDCDRAVG